MTRSLYYYITSATEDPSTLDPDFKEQARRSWLCKRCTGPLGNIQAVDVRLKEGSLVDRPLTFVSGTFLGIIGEEFFSAIDPAIIARDLYLGKVYDHTGALVPSVSTFHGRCKVIVRGNKHVTHRICENCGRRCYFAMGKRYLFPAPRQNADIYCGGAWGLIMRPELFGKLELSLWKKKIYFEKIEVLDAPLDGYDFGSEDLYLPLGDGS